VAHLKGRNVRTDAEHVPSMTWYRRRQERRAAARAARLMVALDALAGSRPKPPRVRRSSVEIAR
jgi:hypothetical protein